MKNFLRKIFSICSAYEIILAALFSFCIIIGRNYRIHGSYGIAGGKTSESVFLFFMLLFLGVIGIKLTDFFLIKLFQSGSYGTLKNLFCRMDANAVFRMLVVVFLLLWLPYFIIQFPGSSWYDTGSEINQCWGVLPFNGMHPLFQTLFTGACIRLGLIFGSANLGVALYILIQLVLAAFVLAYGIRSLYEICRSSVLVIGAVVFWGINPVIPLYLTAMGKDANWSVAIFLLLTCLVKVSVNSKALVTDKAVQIFYTLSLIFVCLLRNAGIAVSVIFSVCVIYASKERARRKAVLLTGIAFIFVAAFQITASLALNVDRSRNEQENLSTPLLQIARLVNQYPEEVTQEEKEAIDRIVSYEAMVNAYHPDISDSIKSTYRSDASSEDKERFWNLYYQYLRKHPLVFLDAIGAKSVGYFDPLTESKVKPVFVLGLQTISGNIDVSTGISLYNYFNLEPMASFMEAIQKTPILKFVTRCGFWMWIFLFALAESMKHKKGRLTFLPAVIFAAGLTATPVNAYFRYSLPLVFVAPLYIAILYTFKTRQETE